MKKARWVSAAAGTALVAAMFALPGAGVAYASGTGNVTGNGNLSLLSGNTVTVPVSAPVNLCGVSLAVLGFANSGCAGGATSNVSGAGGGSDNGNVIGNGNVSLGSGNTVTVPVSAPVNLCGVSGAVAGFANSHCQGGATSNVSGAGGGSSSNGNTTGNFNVPVLSGNTVTAPVSAPVNVCGVSLALLGFSNSGCEDGPTSCIGDNCVPPTCGCQTRPPCQGTCAAPTRPGTSNSTSPARTTAGPARTTTAMSSGTGPARTTAGPARTTTAMSGGDPAASGAGPESATAVTAAMVGSGLPATGAGPDSATTAMSGGDPAASGAGPESATAVTAAMTDSGLPTTGADLLLLGAAALGSIGVGAGTVALARRRRHGEAS